ASAPIVGVADDAGALGDVDAGAAANHYAREFVPEGHRRIAREFTLEQMAIRPANACGLDAHQHLAGTGLGHRYLDCADVADADQSGCKHVATSRARPPSPWLRRYPPCARAEHPAKLECGSARRAACHPKRRRSVAYQER